MTEDGPEEEALDAAFDKLFGQVHHQFRQPDVRKRDRPTRSEQAVAKKKQETTKDRVSPVTKFARMLGDYKTTQEVADELGVSASLVRKWAGDNVAGAPSFVTDFGEHEMSLYTDEDIENLRAHQRAKRRVKPTKPSKKKGKK